MIACDFPDRGIKWYLTRCLKIKSIPSGKCYCSTCRSYLNAKEKPNNELAILISHNVCITNCFMYLSNDVFIVIEGI